MAKHTIERLLDDLDGTEASQTIPFGVDGNNYVIDVNDKHANDLRNTLDPFIAAARKVRTDNGAPVRTGQRPVTDKAQNASIRDWALSEGVELPSRGRIAGVVKEAFAAKDGDALRSALGLELVVVTEEQPKRRRRASEAQFSAAQ